MRRQDEQILILEPYYGGSHKVFLENLRKNLSFSIDLLTLPARKWKWRMRLAAPLFAAMLRTRTPSPLVFCSTFVDVAALRGCGPDWLRRTQIITYYHENQFAYPVQVEDERDMHFAVTNLTSALASDLVLFNSCYNLSTFLDGAAKLIRKAPDMDLAATLAVVREKAMVLSPGVDFTGIDRAEPMVRASEPVIIWNHRWEHDKGPDLFFAALAELDRRALPFKLVVLGEGFARRPAVFDSVRDRFGHRLLHFGRAPRREYERWLKSGDLVVSTARHEFYGIAVLEAVRAGCRPVLPADLAYAELFPEEFLYQRPTVLPGGGRLENSAGPSPSAQGFPDSPGQLADVLQKALAAGRLSADLALALTEPHAWTTLSQEYQKIFSAVMDGAWPE